MTKITEYLEIILEGKDLTFTQAKELLDVIFTGQVGELQIAAFLAAMRVKRATADEIAGFALSLRQHAVAVSPNAKNLLDTCGTGGAAVKTFNISTAAAFVAAGAGAFVAKHGNKAITSACGSADVLAELGVKIDLGADMVEKCIDQANIGFMFAPMFHPAMKFVQPIRKSLDFRTAFNILGPLANPAKANAQVMGVAEIDLMERIAKTLDKLGVQRAFVVHSEGLDEISTMAETKIIELNNGYTKSFEITPEQFGFNKAKIEDLKAGTAAENALIIKNILQGKEHGAKRNIVVLNAAAGIFVSNLAESLEQAIKMAAESIDSGNAFKCLEKLIKISNLH